MKIRMVTRAGFPSFIFNNENVTMCFYLLSFFSGLPYCEAEPSSAGKLAWRKETHAHAHTHTRTHTLLPVQAADSHYVGPGHCKHLRLRILSYLFLDPSV